MHFHPVLGAGVVLLAISGLAPAQPATFPAGKQGAEAYLAAVQSVVNGVEKDLPAISKIAEEAAKLYVDNDDCRLAISGSRAFVFELRGRSGGLIMLEDQYVPKHGFKGIVLYSLREDELEQDVFNIQFYRSTGSKVIVFARPFLIQRAERRYKLEYDCKIDNHAAWTGGVFPLDNEKRWVVPTDEIASMIAGWTWTAEFAAACTRLGKMPTMYQAWVFGGKPRDDKLTGIKFHPGTPQPTPALQAGRAYLAEQRKTLDQIGADELSNVRKVADMAIAARDAHRGVYAMVEAHATIWMFDVPHDAGIFTRAGYWTDLRRDVRLDKDDLLFGVGYAGVMEGETFAHLAENCRQKGVKLAWTFSTCPNRPATTQPAGNTTPPDGEPVIDQHWDYGDAVVQLPGYDIKVIPVSGVAQATVFQMVSAEVVAQRPDHAVVKK